MLLMININIINNFIIYYHRDILEIIAIIFGIYSIILYQKINILSYPIGIISTMIYIYLSFIISLYGNMMINIYYTIINIYGWYLWKNHQDSIQISFSKINDYIKSILISLIIILIVIIIYYINGKFFTKYFLLDIINTYIFFIGTHQMLMKKIDNWIFFTIGNIMAIPLFYYKNMFITSILFIIYTIFSIHGYFIWKNKIKKY